MSACAHPLYPRRYTSIVIVTHSAHISCSLLDYAVNLRAASAAQKAIIPFSCCEGNSTAEQSNSLPRNASRSFNQKSLYYLLAMYMICHCRFAWPSSSHPPVMRNSPCAYVETPILLSRGIAQRALCVNISEWAHILIGAVLLFGRADAESAKYTLAQRQPSAFA